MADPTPVATSPRPGAVGLRRHIPNGLTVLRLLLTVVFVVALAQPQPDQPRLIVALTCFVVAALTDALDGFLARRWNAVSVFGRVADPFADKLLVLSAFVILAAMPDATGGAVPAWMVVVILARELLVTALRSTLESRGVDFSATASGKLKMVLQSVAIPAVLLAMVVADGDLSDPVRGALWWGMAAVTLVTAWSAAPYLSRAVRLSRTA